MSWWSPLAASPPGIQTGPAVCHRQVAQQAVLDVLLQDTLTAEIPAELLLLPDIQAEAMSPGSGGSTARSGGSTSPSTGQTQHLTALGYVIAGSPIPAEGRGWLGDVILLAGLNCESLSKIYTIAMFLLGMLFSPEVGARKLNSLNLDTWKPGEKPELLYSLGKKCVM